MLLRSVVAASCFGSALLAAGACGGGGGSPSQPPPTALVALTLAPDPLTSRPCAGCGNLQGEREVTTEATLRESAGVAARVSRFLVSVRTASGAEIVARADRPGIRDSIPANGSTAVSFDTHFPGGAGNANLPAVLLLEVELVDANGHALTLADEATILRP